MAILQCELRGDSIRRDTSLVVILPQDKFRNKDPAAVLYLLHGRRQNAQAWMRYSRIESYAEKYNIAVVMPEVQLSFYNDMRHGGAFFTYITQELPDLSGKMFHIPVEPERTYVAGLSMGGYGTLRCIFNRPDLYAGGASFSAVTDIHWRLRETRETDPGYRDLQAVFGAMPEADASEDLFSPSAPVFKTSRRPKLYISCGISDARYEQNVRLSEFLKEQGYNHEFQEWPGDHDWDFWDLSIQKALGFFFGDPVS